MAEWESAPNHLIYERVRTNVMTLLEEHPDAGHRPVPGCPEWNVLELAEHFVDICEVATHRLESNDPNAREIRKPSGGMPMPRLLDEWRVSGPRLDDLAAAHLESSTNKLVLDAFTHELDLCAALGAAPPDGHPGYGVLGFVIGGFSGQVRRMGLPTLEISIDGSQWLAGEGGRPAATLTAASTYDLLRSLTGRRTLDQIAELEWSAAPGPWLPAFDWGPFTPPEQPAEKPLSGTK